MDDLGIQVAFVTSERLYDEQRQQISNTLRIVRSRMATAAVMRVLSPTSVRRGYAYHRRGYYRRDRGSSGRAVTGGEAGEIIVTHLATRDFPFIRYRTGDIGVLDSKPCVCGRGLPVLRKSRAAVPIFWLLKNGTVIHGLALIYILRYMPQIRNFKIIQESQELTRVWAVTDKGLVRRNGKNRAGVLKARLGHAANILIEEMTEIPAGKIGEISLRR